MIRGVLFDLGGTLLEVPEPAEIIVMVLEENGILKDLQEVSSAVATAEASFTGNEFIGKEHWIEWNRRVLSHLGISSARTDLASHIDSSWWSRAKVSLYPDVIPLLNELKSRGIKMGAVTNGVSSDLPYLVDDVGLGDYLEVKVSSDLAGRRKPSPRIFLHASKEIGLPPSDILFVGDEEELDYKPSESVGMTPVLISRKKPAPLVRNAISDLGEIIKFL
jgi:putative hydrolase of the HAD superfamily